ncbi:velvet factor [Pilobolus umbonatus]|nr:velvet factor [Pilobolus umbonatus]
MDPPPPFRLIRPSRSNIVYHLNVVQHPVKGRSCGFGEKDRRLLDPPPIVQLTATLNGEPLSISLDDLVLYIMQCDIYDETGRENRSIVYPSSYSNRRYMEEAEKLAVYNMPVRNLLGSLVSNAYELYSPNSSKGIFFIFGDLSVRAEGTFTLQFRFCNLGYGEPMTMSTIILAEVFSHPFTIYSPRNFSGMSATTELSKCFAKQGVKIITRNSNKKSID